MLNMHRITKDLRRELDDAKHQVTRLETALHALNGAGGTHRAGGTRILSKDARARIAEAQRARWAKYKAAKAGTNVVAMKPRRKRTGLHWTQTPKGRAFMRKSAKARFGK